MQGWTDEDAKYRKVLGFCHHILTTVIFEYYSTVRTVFNNNRPAGSHCACTNKIKHTLAQKISLWDIEQIFI
jgi:hypothetical protein